MNIRTDNKSCRVCAFCRHWNDPTNSNIRPKGIFMREIIDHGMKRFCSVKGNEYPAFKTACDSFVLKI